DRHVGPVVAHLLLPRAVDLLDVVEVLLDGRAVGDGLRDLGHRGVGIGTEVRYPAVAPLDQDDPDDAAGWLVGRQEGLEGLGHRRAVQEDLLRVPAVPVRGALGQAEAPRSVLARPAAGPAGAGAWWHRDAVQGRVLAGPADDGGAGRPGRPKEGPL